MVNSSLDMEIQTVTTRLQSRFLQLPRPRRQTRLVSYLLSFLGIVLTILLFPIAAPAFGLKTASGLVGLSGGLLSAPSSAVAASSSYLTASAHILSTYTSALATSSSTLSSSSGLFSVQISTASTVSEKVLGGAVITAGYVGDALSAVKREREYTKAEQKAFQQFADDVDSMAVAPASSTMGAQLSGLQTSKHSQLGQIRERYRETVLSTPDYDSAYGESFEEHITAEFGAETAAALASGGPLTAPAKRLLVENARTAARRRGEFVDALDAEYSAVKQFRGDMEEIDEFLETTRRSALREQSFSGLVQTDQQLRTVRQQSARLLECRQAQIHQLDQSRQCPGSGFLQEYVYRDLDVSFPVLSGILSRIQELDRGRRQLIRELLRRE